MYFPLQVTDAKHRGLFGPKGFDIGYKDELIVIVPAHFPQLQLDGEHVIVLILTIE